MRMHGHSMDPFDKLYTCVKKEANNHLQAFVGCWLKQLQVSAWMRDIKSRDHGPEV